MLQSNISCLIFFFFISSTSHIISYSCSSRNCIILISCSSRNCIILISCSSRNCIMLTSCSSHTSPRGQTPQIYTVSYFVTFNTDFLKSFMKSQKIFWIMNLGHILRLLNILGNLETVRLKKWQMEKNFRMSQGKNFQQLIFFKICCVSLQEKYFGNITTYMAVHTTAWKYVFCNKFILLLCHNGKILTFLQH